MLERVQIRGDEFRAEVVEHRAPGTECSFHVFSRATEERLDARVIVAFRNRVLQTALLRAPINRGDEADRDGTIELEPELSLRPSLDELAQRREFDAALVLNHDETGVSGITAISDDTVARFTPSQTMNDEVANLDLLLTQIVLDPKSYIGDLESEAVTSMLRQFAQHGSLLYDHIVRDGGLASAGLAGDGPIQVISAVADARLPVEFIYAREAPTNDAPLCPNAAASLRHGECDAACTSAGTRERDFICPLAFWGLKRTIERHAHDRRLRALLGGDAYAVLSEPTSRRNTLDVLRAGLVATTQRVEKTVAGGTQRICDRITSGTTASLAPVTTWESWEEKIDSQTPSLLVLIVHTTAAPTDSTIQQMEIGVESWLSVANLEARHVRRSDVAPPLVLLLGCETGVSDRHFANFVNRIRNRGAAVVVAAGAKIHSLHAVPVAEEFVDALRSAVQRNGATLGDVMRDVRREMLARGIPMVLTLSAFGDADWRLTHRT